MRTRRSREMALVEGEGNAGPERPGQRPRLDPTDSEPEGHQPQAQAAPPNAASSLDKSRPGPDHSGATDPTGTGAGTASGTSIGTTTGGPHPLAGPDAADDNPAASPDAYQYYNSDGESVGENGSPTQGKWMFLPHLGALGRCCSAAWAALFLFPLPKTAMMVGCFAPHCGRRSARPPYAAGSTPMPTRDAAAQLDQPHSCSRNSRAPAWARCTWRACRRRGGAPLSPTATPTPTPSPSPTVCALRALRALSALHPKGAHWGVLEVCSATRRGPCPSRPPFSAPWCTDIPSVGCD